MSTVDPLQEQIAIQDYFEAYLDMFTTPGWQKFVEDLQDSLDQDQKSAVSRCKTAELWHEERGAQAKALKILTFETMIRNSYEEYKESLQPADPQDED